MIGLWTRWVAASTLIALAAALTPAEEISAPTGLQTGIVGLAVTYQEWDEDRPWARAAPRSRQAAAVVVEGPYLLTTAQMVADATFIRLEKAGRASAAVPRVALVDRDIDLALLTIDDEAFWSDLHPVRVAEHTPTEGAVRTVRWNEAQLEVLTSRVKRFEVQPSFLGRVQHVFLQVQTDLTGGGWSEPVFDGSRLVGLTVSQSEQRARVIPAEILHAFLRQASNTDDYRGFAAFGFAWQVNNDRALARWLGQEGEPRGVIVRQIPWGTSGCGALRPTDILLEIDGQPIDAKGFYRHPRFGLLSFDQLAIERHRPGDTVPVRVLREGQPLLLDLPLRAYPAALDLLPTRRPGIPPPYLVAGGLVFRELDGDYLRSWGPEWAHRAPLRLTVPYFLGQESQSPERRRLIALSAVLPSSYNVGYHELSNAVVTRINGIPVDSIVDVREALAHPVDRLQRIGLAPGVGFEEIVLDADSLDVATAEILKTYRIPSAERLPERAPPALEGDCPGNI